MFVIDGENCVLGRIAAQAAKAALNGKTVNIVNAEKIIISGRPDTTIAEYRTRLNRKNLANPLKSAKLSRRPDFFVKRAIRGMLPRKSQRGLEAYRRIKAHIGVPTEFAGKGRKIGDAGEMRAKKISIGDLCQALGWKSALSSG